jgi:hypothetical protein
MLFKEIISNRKIFHAPRKEWIMLWFRVFHRKIILYYCCELKVFKIIVENNEEIKVMDDPYRIVGIIQKLLRMNNQLEELIKYVWLCALGSDKRILGIEPSL